MSNVLCSGAGLRRGFVAGLPSLASYAVAGVVMGVAYRTAGLSFAAAGLFSLLVYSGTAQAVTLGLWATPPPLTAMMLAVLAINARYFVMGAHLQQSFAQLPRSKMLPILFWLADASWLMTVAEIDKGRRDAGYLLGCSMALALGWVGGTVAGYGLPLEPRGPLAVAAAFLPLAFVVALLPTQWRGLHNAQPWALAAAVSIVATWAGAHAWAMLIGGGAGTLLAALRNDES